SASLYASLDGQRGLCSDRRSAARREHEPQTDALLDDQQRYVRGAPACDAGHLHPRRRKAILLTSGTVNSAEMACAGSPGHPTTSGGVTSLLHAEMGVLHTLYDKKENPYACAVACCQAMCVPYVSRPCHLPSWRSSQAGDLHRG